MTQHTQPRFKKNYLKDYEAIAYDNANVTGKQINR
ncbi:MAG: hypothetical protein HLUCCA11_09355 [Phormidesmis priestleyi Ana]|uniref:Uncharacterized protein n=1 Tax=Phormidesmis priestleyi Ana TaxID=1666911 RepID=A0A0P7YZA8_9CYAN|nr:MAG: hypothetical protein HLUCCA11_09355 [Phormidesmis priestleyi Ana]